MSIKPLLLILALIACAQLSGCVTSYQKLTAFGFSGGYSDEDLGRDVYRIRFAANGFTSYETAQCFWLYRCAELTLQRGFQGFEILSDIRLSEIKRPKDLIGVSDRIQPAFFIPLIIPIPSGRSNKPLIIGDIHLLKAPIEAAPPRIFDARMLKDALEPFLSEPIKSGGNVKPHIHEYLLPPGKITKQDEA